MTENSDKTLPEYITQTQGKLDSLIIQHFNIEPTMMTSVVSDVRAQLTLLGSRMRLLGDEQEDKGKTQKYNLAPLINAYTLISAALGTNSTAQNNKDFNELEELRKYILTNETGMHLRKTDENNKEVKKLSQDILFARASPAVLDKFEQVLKAQYHRSKEQNAKPLAVNKTEGFFKRRILQSLDKRDFDKDFSSKLAAFSTPRVPVNKLNALILFSTTQLGNSLDATFSLVQNAHELSKAEPAARGFLNKVEDTLGRSSRLH